MRLDDYRETYYDLSGKASDVARQLCFAGIALIWIFRNEGQAPLAVPGELLLPTACFIAALALDLLQYTSGALVWGSFHRYHEMQLKDKTNPELTAPIYLNWPALFAFWSKIGATIVAYVLVFRYVLSVL